MIKPEQQITQALLEIIQQRFYSKGTEKQFYSDKKMLIYAITWPAGWFRNRQLHCSKKKYIALITHQLDNIKKHGNSTLYQRYFPRYLLKCLQDHLYHNQDKLYNEFTHTKNIITLLDKQLKLNNTQHDAYHSKHIDVMARTNQLLYNNYRKNKPITTSKQLELF